MSIKMFKRLSLVALVACVSTIASCSNNTSSASFSSSTPITSSTTNASSATSSSSSSSSSSTKTPSSSSSSTAKPSSSSVADSVIKSLTAKSENVSMKIDESLNAANYYVLTGKTSLNAKQKLCTVVSENENIVSVVNNKTMKAKGLGTTKITVTSKVDETKSCSFIVTVTDVYFDRTESLIPAGDEMDKELKEDGGVIRTSSVNTGEYMVKGVSGTKVFVETEFTIHSVANSEKYPKIGVFASSVGNTDPNNNKLYLFLNAVIGASNNTSWDGIGICEVENGTNWAWNPGVGDTTARHKDFIYNIPEAVTYETKVKLGMARDGFTFHFWVNDVYVKSAVILDYLMGTYDSTTLTYTPADSMVGFFQFNSDVTFENYDATADEAKVNEKIASIAEPVYVTDWDQDSN